ncbi:MAG: type II secretion system protein GspJ [Planctomycetota bacterium]|nr:type II secretion system protein GspJ [Planctomycetota bacterium]
MRTVRTNLARSIRRPLAGATTSRAFTLVEIIVALIVGGVVAGVTTTAISQFIRAQSRASNRAEAFARASAAADRIAHDLMHSVRDRDLLACRVAVIDQAGDDSDADVLLLLTRSLERSRGDDAGPESPDREVQYKLASDGAAGLALWRRVDATPDEYLDAGGVATQLVEGIVSLRIRAFDGEAWRDAWDSDQDGLPHGVQILVVAQAPESPMTAAVRRVVALDRVPLAPTPELAEEATGAQSPSSTQQPSENPQPGSGASPGAPAGNPSNRPRPGNRPQDGPGLAPGNGAPVNAPNQQGPGRQPAQSPQGGGGQRGGGR